MSDIGRRRVCRSSCGCGASEVIDHDADEKRGYGPELALLEAFDWGIYGELIEAIMINSF